MAGSMVNSLSSKRLKEESNLLSDLQMANRILACFQLVISPEYLMALLVHIFRILDAEWTTIDVNELYELSSQMDSVDCHLVTMFERTPQSTRRSYPGKFENVSTFAEIIPDYTPHAITLRTIAVWLVASQIYPEATPTMFQDV